MSPYSWPHASVAAPHPPVLLSLKKNTDEVDKKKQWPGDQATSSSLKMLLEYIIVGNEPPTSSLVSLGYDSIHVCFESPSSSTQCHHRKLPWVIQVSETNQLTTSSSKIIALQSTSPNDTLKVQEFHGWPCYLKKSVVGTSTTNKRLFSSLTFPRFQSKVLIHHFPQRLWSLFHLIFCCWKKMGEEVLVGPRLGKLGLLAKFFTPWLLNGFILLNQRTQSKTKVHPESARIGRPQGDIFWLHH